MFPVSPSTTSTRHGLHYCPRRLAAVGQTASLYHAMALGKPKLSFTARQLYHFRQQLWAGVVGKPQGSWKRCRAKCRVDMGSLCPVVKRSSIFCGLTVFSSAGAAQGPCAIWGTRLLIGAKSFLAPFSQFMPLTGEAGTLGAPTPQLKPSVADYGYKPQRFSSFLPSQPLTK